MIYLENKNYLPEKKLSTWKIKVIYLENESNLPGK